MGLSVTTCLPLSRNTKNLQKQKTKKNPLCLIFTDLASRLIETISHNVPGCVCETETVTLVNRDLNKVSQWAKSSDTVLSENLSLKTHNQFLY